VQAVMREKNLMMQLGKRRKDLAPFFVHLSFTFQSSSNLYFMVMYCKNGDMLQLLQQAGSFELPTTAFYTGELVRGLECLRGLGVVHRDLKPENILLDEHMHIKISDFGSAKQLKPTEEPDGRSTHILRRCTFVGTAQYVSPEMLNSRCISFASDLWSLGCVVYQMVTGQMPFKGRSEYLIFKEILDLAYEFTPDFYPEASDFVKKLLVLDGKCRLGAQDPPPNLPIPPPSPNPGRGGEGDGAGLPAYDASFRYASLRSHPLLASLPLDRLHTLPPPSISAFAPPPHAAHTWDNNVEAGLENRELELLNELVISTNSEPESGEATPPGTRLTNGSADSCHAPPTATPSPAHARTPSQSSLKKARRNMCDMTRAQHNSRLQQQQRDSKWHGFVAGNLILKAGELDKRKPPHGILPRRRMFLLTTGPRLFYVDPQSMSAKGEVPLKGAWVEARNFSTFFIHTPSRTYYLEDPNKTSHLWKEALEDVKDFYFPEA